MWTVLSYVGRNNQVRKKGDGGCVFGGGGIKEGEKGKDKMKYGKTMAVNDAIQRMCNGGNGDGERERIVRLTTTWRRGCKRMMSPQCNSDDSAEAGIRGKCRVGMKCE